MRKLHIWYIFFFDKYTHMVYLKLMFQEIQSHKTIFTRRFLHQLYTIDIWHSLFHYDLKEKT